MFGLFKRDRHFSRGAKRFRRPVLKVGFDEGTFDTLDWGLGGCRLAGYRGKKRKKGEKIIISEIGVGMKKPTRLLIYAKVVKYKTHAEELQLEFTDLGETGDALLKDYMSKAFGDIVRDKERRASSTVQDTNSFGRKD
ncbi:MAG: hypothetical protein ACPGO3_06065 [Magnetospiraceae bacterium]